MEFLRRSADTLHWRQWDDQFIVFDELSGQTHQLDTLTACTLLCIEDGASNFSLLVDAIATYSSIINQEFSIVFPSIIKQLNSASLIEVTPE